VLSTKVKVDAAVLKADRSDRIEQTDRSLLCYGVHKDGADLSLHRTAVFGRPNA
jgi:hypothetical protein